MMGRSTIFLILYPWTSVLHPVTYRRQSGIPDKGDIPRSDTLRHFFPFCSSPETRNIDNIRRRYPLHLRQLDYRYGPVTFEDDNTDPF